MTKMTAFNIGECHPRTPHLLADLIELLLVVEYNGKSIFYKNDLRSLLAQGNISAEEIDDESQENESMLTQDKNVKLEAQLEDVWIHLYYRDKSFNKYYPFDVADEHVSLNSELSLRQRYYLFLLTCSRLRSFMGKAGIVQKWAKLFTKVAKSCLQGLLPSHATVKIFDANSEDRATYYTNRLPDALIILGRDLALKVDMDECSKKHHSGDEGIDLVGIVSFEDTARANFAVLGQCAAQGANWPSKRLEAHPINLKNIFPQINTLTTLFIPTSFRTSNGEWVDNKFTTGLVLIDRLRMLTLLEKSDAFAEPIILEFENELLPFKGLVQ